MILMTQNKYNPKGENKQRYYRVVFSLPALDEDMNPFSGT